MGETVKTTGKFYFQVTKNSERMAMPLETLELSTRAYNSLRRSGINTVGDVISMMENLRTQDNLLKAGRNIGKNTAHEIMMALWLFEVAYHGNEDEQDAFITKVLDQQNELRAQMGDVDPQLAAEEIARRKAATLAKVNRAVGEAHA